MLNEIILVNRLPSARFMKMPATYCQGGDGGGEGDMYVGGERVVFFLFCFVLFCFGLVFYYLFPLQLSSFLYCTNRRLPWWPSG